MFERFSGQARAVVVGACEEAERLGADHIGSVHLLIAAAAPGTATAGVLAALGLDAAALRAGAGGRGGVRGRTRPDDAEALATLGIDLDEIRRRVEAAFGPGALESTRAGRRPGRLPFAPHAKQALELSLREAIRLKHNRIVAEHVVLGALRAADADLDALLERRGRTREQVRTAMEAALSPGAIAG